MHSLLPTITLCRCLFTVGLLCGVFVGAAGAQEGGALASAAEHQQWSKLSQLLAKGTPSEVLNAAQPDGMTALHWVVHHGQYKSVQELLTAGADVNARTAYGISPLSIACTLPEPKVVAALLAAGADLDQRLPGHTSLLMLAARAGNAAVVQRLVEAARSRGQDVPKWLNAREHNQQTALMWAAAAGNTAAVQTLIKAGADPELTTQSGFTAFLFAVRQGHINTTRYFVETGADVNYSMQPERTGARVPRRGTSPLIMAIESGHFELAQFLLDAGADPNDQRCGYAALHVLTWVRKPKHGENPDGDPPPRGSGNVSDLQLARSLVAAGADVNLQLEKGSGGRAKLNHRGATPMLLAGKTCDLPYLQLLVELGANPLLTNADGTTPLIAASGVGVQAVGEEPGTVAEVRETIDYLVSLGCNVNAVDENGETVMHGAAYRNYPETVAHLADLGADPQVWNHKNKWGWTPVMIAQGKRPGSFKPSPETVAALEHALLEHELPNIRRPSR